MPFRVKGVPNQSGKAVDFHSSFLQFSSTNLAVFSAWNIESVHSTPVWINMESATIVLHVKQRMRVYFVVQYLHINNYSSLAAAALA